MPDMMSDEDVDRKQAIRVAEQAALLMRATRSQYHLTLGEAISQLSSCAPDIHIAFDFNGRGPRKAMSYRGYYEDLAFDWMDDDDPEDPAPGVGMCGPWLSACRAALGKTFQGYKGGDYVMTAETPLWVAQRGETGRAMLGIQNKGTDRWNLVIITKVID